MQDHEEDTSKTTSAAAATSAAATPAKSPETATPAPPPPTKEEIAIIESHIEANVQRGLDGLDTWKLTAPFRGDRPDAPPDPSKCSKERHTCNLDVYEASKTCVGCILYKNIVRERSSFPVGGRSEVCDYVATGIAEPLIFAFVRDKGWLSPMEKISGKWFVKHPLTFFHRGQTSMVPVLQVGIKRNKVRVLSADTVFELLNMIGDKERILGRLHDYWHTEAGGVIYSIDELLDMFEPLTACAAGLRSIGIDGEPVNTLSPIVMGLQKLITEVAK